MTDVTARLLHDLISLFVEKFDMELKAICVSDPYYTELLMDGMRKAGIIPDSFLFIGRGVRWNNVPIIYSNEPGIQVVTMESYRVTQNINEHMENRGDGLEAVLADIENRDDKPDLKKKKVGELEMMFS